MSEDDPLLDQVVDVARLRHTTMSQDRKFHAKPGGAVASAPPSQRRSESDEPIFEPRTRLGRELWALRQKIVASVERLLDADEIDREVDRRRGGVESRD